MKLTKRGTALLLLTLVVSVIPVVSPKDARAGIGGTLTDLGTLGGPFSWAVAINDSGQVVGGSSTTSSLFPGRAFSWTEEGGMIDVGTLGGEWSVAVAVNSVGQVVGHSSTDTGDAHAFSWTSASGMVDLGTLGGNRSIAVAVNDNGEVAGVSTTASGDERAFLWTSSDGMIDLGTLSGAFSEIGWTWFSALGSPGGPALSDSGQVVGWSETSTGAVHAFSWTDGSMEDLGTLGGEMSFALSVNTIGQVAGVAQFPQHAFLWTPEAGMVDLGTLGGEASEAVSINDAGQVAGNSTTAGGESHGFLWTAEEGMIDLGSLGGGTSQVGGASVVTLPGGPALNESGQVVGSSVTSTGDNHAFSWTAAGGMIDIGTLGGTSSGAFAVNDEGQVVGISDTSSGDFHAFLWDPPESAQDPATAITALIGQVETLGLQHGLETSLVAKLDTALIALGDTNLTNDVAATQALQAFVLQVTAQRGLGISEADADDLIAAANEIILTLPSPSD